MALYPTSEKLDHVSEVPRHYVLYCILCMYLICYLYTIVLTKVTRNKDI